MTVLFAIIASVSVCVSVVICIAYRRVKMTIEHNLDYFDHLNDSVPIDDDHVPIDQVDLKRKYPKLYRGV